MMIFDATFYLGDKIAAPVVAMAQRCLLEAHGPDHYNLDRVREMVLDSLVLIEGKVNVMLNVDFKTARDALASWERSAEPPHAPTQMANLILARNCARKAVHSVPDPRDKLSALSILLLAEYKLVVISRQQQRQRHNEPQDDQAAVSSSIAEHVVDSDWSAAKDHVHRLFVQFVAGFGELRTAATEELSSSVRCHHHRRRYHYYYNLFLWRSPGKRRDLLRQFMALKANLAKLPPVNRNTGTMTITTTITTTPTTTTTTRTRGIMTDVVNDNGDDDDDLAYITRAAKKLMGCQATIKCREAVLCCCTVDGHKVLTGGKHLRLWNILSGRPILELRGHTAPISCCDAIGTKALTGSYDQTLRLWDVRDGTELRVFHGHTNWIWCCRLFQGGRRAMSGGLDRTVRVWDLEPQNRRQSLEVFGHEDWVRCCAIFDNGRRALCGDDTNTLRVWNLQDGRLVQSLVGHHGFVSCCAVFDDNVRAVSGSFDKTLIVWDCLQEAPRVMSLLKGHAKAVTCCCIADHGRRVVSGGADKMTKVWCVQAGTLLHSYGEHSDQVLSCSVFNCETIFVTGGYDRTLRMWELPKRNDAE